jgi:hypothetical protein
VTEAVADFAHLYSYGVSKCTFYTVLTGRPIDDLEDLNYPSSDSFNHGRLYTLPSNKFPKYACATKTAHSLYDLLMYYLQKKYFIQCPPDMTRHTAHFVTALKPGLRVGRQVNLRWRKDRNGPPTTLLLLLRRRGWSRSNLTSVPTGLPILRSIPRQRCSANCSLWTRTGPKRVCRILPRSRLSNPDGIWGRWERRRVQGHHLNDQQVYATAECLPKLRDDMCNGEPVGASGCTSGAFRLNVTRSGRMERLYFDTHYITLILPDIEYLARMFNVVQQQLRDYILAMPDMSYVTTALNSVT